MTAMIRRASTLAVGSTYSSSANSTPLKKRPKTTSGSADRYRLTPHARITISSLFFVSSPIVTSAATSTDSGMM